MLPWLYLHFPRLQLDALEQEYQAHKAEQKHATQESGPAAIIVVDTRQNQICQLNEEAQSQGIRLGMGLATAIALSAELNIVEYKVQLAQTRLHELAQWLYEVVADIVLFEPDGLALKVSNMLALYGSFENYWAQITPLLQQHKVSYHAAMAQTVTAARLLARSGANQMHTDKTALREQLAELPVTLLELPKLQIEQMQRVGIQHLHQLLEIDSKSLGRRFGLEVLNYLSAINGNREVPLNHYQPPEHYNQYLELFHEIAQTQVLLFPLQRMVRDMSEFLLKRELEVTELTITLNHRDKEHHPNTLITIGSATGEYRSDKWMALINLKVERTELIAPVVGITITTNETIDKHCTEGALFGDNKAQMTPGQLVSLLQAKVGRQHIVGVELLPDHRPEFAFGYGAPLATNTNPATAQHPKLRPLLLLPEALPATEKYQILHGPERIRSAWWSKDPVYRDYFVARRQDGAVCWLYNEPGGNWYLQGYFC